MNRLQNKDMVGVWIGGLISLLGAVAVFLPGVSGMDMMDGGYALIFVGFFIIIAGLITGGMFWQRAKEMNRILAGDNILVQWVYSPEQSQRQIREEYTSLKTYNRSTFLIVFAWFVVIGGVFMGMDLINSGEVNWFFAILFFGVLAVIAVVASIAPAAWRREAQRSSREVIIARNGVVMNGALHTWVPPLNRLENVQLNDTSGQKSLDFKIRSLSKTSLSGYTTYTVSIPVPPGMETDVQKAAEYFQGGG